MKQPYKLIMPFLLPLLALAFKTNGQTTIGTTANFSNGATASTVTFNFQNTNTYPVIITDVEGIVEGYGTNYAAEIYYTTSAISGTPGNINAANGWTSAGTVTGIVGVANTTTTVTQPIFSGIGLTVPAGSTYGIAIAIYATTGAQRVDTSGASLTISGGGCNIITGTNIGYATTAVPPAAPTTANRGWIGKLTFINGAACSGTPSTPVVSGPSAICANAPFTLTSSGYSLGAGLSYIWQYYNTTLLTWVDIAGATSPASYTNIYGITAATQYRLKTTCANGSAQSLSNTVTVALGSGLAGGTYTINQNAPSSSSNFTSFGAAAAAMSCGITGAVTLNVTPGSGPYTEAPIFNDIPGASTTNTIRLNGNGEILQTNTDVGTYAVLTLSGTRYMTIDSLTVRSLGVSLGVGIRFTDTARYDSITHCLVDMSSLQTTSSSVYNSVGISLSYYYGTVSNYAPSYGCYVGYNHVTASNGAGGPCVGIADGGWATNYYQTQNDTGNIIAHNEVENFAYYGIMFGGNNNSQVLYNNIHRTNKTATTYFWGIRSWTGYYNSSGNGNSSSKIIGNRVHDPGQGTAAYYFYGIYVYNYYYTGSTLSGTDDMLIANNVIYNVNNSGNNTSSGYAIFGIGFQTYSYYYSSTTSYSRNIRILHNTMDYGSALSNSAGTMYGIYGYKNYHDSTSTNVYVKNNIVTYTSGTTGNKYGAYYYGYNTTGFTTFESQRNNYYLNSSQSGSQYHTYWFGTNYSTLAAYQTAFPAQEVGSLSVDPQYFSPATGDFTPTNTSLQANGTNLLAYVPTDINGHTRSATPTPGAFEFGPDAAATALVAPTGTYCSSLKQVQVRIKNPGAATLYSMKVYWQLNGVGQTTYNWTGSLAPGDSATVTLGTGLFLPNTTATIKAWTYLPNGQADFVPANDTFTATTQPSTSIPVDIGP
ncbi:MAG: hypothetical protein QM642_09670, partial [Edaphocola sp.]